MAFKIGNDIVIDANGNVPSTTLGPANVLQVVNHIAPNKEGLSGDLGGANPPDYTDGTSYTSFSFTPKSATSTLWLFSSTASQYEGPVNELNDMYLAAYYDTVTIQVAVAPTPYYIWNSALDIHFVKLNQTFSSWGTSQKTIDIRVGRLGGGSSNMHFNRDFQYSQQTRFAWWGVTVLEILQ